MRRGLAAIAPIAFMLAGCQAHPPAGSPRATPAIRPEHAGLVTGSSPAASMATARWRHASILLPDGRVLVAGGDGADGGWLASAEIYDPATDRWASAPDLSVPRFSTSATLMRDGRVLLLGGDTRDVFTAEVFDPRTGTWSLTGNLVVPRNIASVGVLPDGTVWACGGSIYNASTGGYGASRTCESFTPDGGWVPLPSMIGNRENHTANTTVRSGLVVAGGWVVNNEVETMPAGTAGPWVALPGMSVARVLHTATELHDGRIVVAGGSTFDGPPYGTVFDSFEVLSGGAWLDGGTMAVARSHHSATLLPDGRLIVAGGAGVDGGATSTTELFVSDLWKPGPDLAGGRRAHGATLLPDGRLLLSGGASNAGATASAELLHASDDTFTPGPPLPSANAGMAVAVLPGDQLLSIGRDGTHLLDGASGAWLSAAPMHAARENAAAVALADGRVVVTGGRGPARVHGSAEVRERDGGWDLAASMSEPRELHAAALLPRGLVLVAGGRGASGDLLSSVEIFDSYGQTWRRAPPLSLARERPAAVRLPDGRVLVAGGTTADGAGTTAAEVFDPATATWRAVPMLRPRAAPVATVLTSGAVLLTGASGGDPPSAERFDPSSDAWTLTSAPLRSRLHHRATLLDDGRVLVTGGRDGTGPLAAAEIYDPVPGTWSAAPATLEPRTHHLAWPLSDRRVILLGGLDANGAPLVRTELFGGLRPGPWRPALSAVAGGVPGDSIQLTGQRFTQVSEASSGNVRSSATNFPVVQLRRGDEERWTPAPASSWTDTTARVDHTAQLPPAVYSARVVVNGVPSVAQPLELGAGVGEACESPSTCFSGTCEANRCIASIPGPQLYRVGCGCDAIARRPLLWVALIALCLARARPLRGPGA